MHRLLLTILGITAALTVTACNANSDAVKILQTENTSLRATNDFYQSLGPTMTAQVSNMNLTLVAAKSDLATSLARNDDLTSQLNAHGGQATTVVVNPPADSSGSDVTPNATNAGVAADATFNFASVVTARSKDGNGCASGASSAFSTTDSAIWVIADVRNFKRGTAFTVHWANSTGDFTHENTWTATSDGVQLCVHFYIEPRTLGLKAGTYSVSLSAPGLTSSAVEFTVQSPNQGNQGQGQPTSAPQPTTAS